MICDSDPAALQAMRAILQRTCAIDAVNSIDDITQSVNAVVPDVIVCELNHSSITALPNWRDTAVIFTYSDEHAPAAQALRSGAAYCIAKPVDVPTLAVLIRRLMDQRRILDQAQRVTRHIEQEFADARRIQEAMLPPTEARAGGATLARRWRPSTQLGGDLVDYVEIDATRFAILIADVSGHGTPAAMLTTLVKMAFRSTKDREYAPEAVAGAVAASLSQVCAERFVTLIAARVDARSRVIEYVNAGHPAALVFYRGEIVTRLESTHPLICKTLPDESWHSARATLPANCGVLFFTDGVTEAVGDSGRFGADRLSEALARHRGGGSVLLDGILASVDAFTRGHPLVDDITLLTATLGLPGLA